MDKPKVFYVMGVSGCGKSTIASLIGDTLNIKYVDGDDFHPIANIQKMEAGSPLNDKDRAGWLQAIHQFVKEELVSRSLVVACSALKKKYRKILSEGIEAQVTWIYLKGNFKIIQERIQEREHFMPPSLLQSQFDALEEPSDAIVLNISQTPEAMINQLLQELN